MAKKGSDVWSLEERARKRRKLDSNIQEQSAKGKDEWDDSMELTQAELETLDVIASQAIVEDVSDINTAGKKHTSVGEPDADDMLFFVKPSFKPHGFARHSTSSSSGSTAHPASFSSRSASDTSGSLSSHTSENGKGDGETVQSLRLKLQEEIKKAQEEKYRNAGEMAFLRESLRRQEDELERVRADRDAAMEKEKVVQRDSEKMLQSRLDSMTSEAQFKEREYKTLQEQYYSVQQRLKRLEQEKQFQSPSGNLAEAPSVRMPSPKKVPVRPSPPSKQKLRQIEEAGTQRKLFPTTQTFLEQARLSPQESSTKISVSNTGCQTTVSETIVRPRKSRRLKLKLSPACDSETVSGKDIVQHLLQTSAVQQPVGASDRDDWDVGLMGLMHSMSSSLSVAGLAYRRTGGSALTSLSPIKPKRQTPKKGIKEDTLGGLQVVSKEHFQLAIDGLSQLLDDRLHMPAEKRDPDYTDSRVNDMSSDINKNCSSRASENVPIKPASSKHPKLAACSVTSRGPDWTAASSSALILPLLTDYIQHYVDLLNLSTAKSGAGSGLMRSQHHPVSPYRSNIESTSHSATTSSSCESSLDSLNSSLLQLLHDGHMYAASIERYTSTALSCTTLLLLLCPALGDFILAPQLPLRALASTLTSSTSGNSSAVEGDAKSEVDADDEKSVSSVEIRILSAAFKQSTSPDIKPRVQTPMLFHLVLQLVTQDLKDSNCAPEVMAQALSILTLLCQGSREEHIPKLQSILSRGVLTNCLRQTSHGAVMVGTVKLLQAMFQHASLCCKICAKSENCPLFLMHQINVRKDIQAKPGDMVQFYKEYISCLSSVIAVQQQGLQQLLSTCCPCSNELVSGIVLALYKLFKFYQGEAKMSQMIEKGSPSPYSGAPPVQSHSLSQPAADSPPQPVGQDCVGTLWTLGQGVTLLHSVAQADGAFLQHHLPVQPQYVCLLSGLREEFRTSAAAWDFHLSALEELCDFDADFSDLSQESESEDRMDQG
ncbi:hypothetical protein EGW08_009339 [Elysia chlorotica]|uniref:ATR-interacting protein n=1 Tax=Elysia chlorotica TaxID=188477 RepID=A0A3S1BG68_ELYCH|nr:hypothetical protein EGW08_009339 [Elysia chlorotica]